MNKMKKIASILVLATFVVSCSTGLKNMEANMAVIKKYVSAVENMDFETMGSLLDDNFVGFGPSYGDSITKNEAIENWKMSSEYIYESITYNRSRSASVLVHEGENKGDWISVWAELTIHYKWTEKPVTLWANSIYQIKNEKIVKSYTFYNEADAYRQLGYEFVAR